MISCEDVLLQCFTDSYGYFELGLGWSFGGLYVFDFVGCLGAQRVLKQLTEGRSPLSKRDV